MNRFGLDYVLLLVGIFLIVGGVFCDPSTSLGLLLILAGFVLVFAGFISSQIDRMAERVFSKIIDAEVLMEPYDQAQNLMKNATEAWGTFFADYSWEITRKTKIFGKSASKKQDTYNKIVRGRLNSGILRYAWIIYVNDFDKWLALVSRVKTGLKHNIAAIQLGHIKIWTLPPAANSPKKPIRPIPHINILVAKNSSGFLGTQLTFLRSRREVGLSIFIRPITDTNRKIIEAVKKWHILLQKESWPIVDENCIYLSNIKSQLNHIKLSAMDNQRVIQELKEITELAEQKGMRIL